MALKRLPRKPNILAVDDKRANLLALEATLGDDYNLTCCETSHSEPLQIRSWMARPREF